MSKSVAIVLSLLAVLPFTACGDDGSAGGALPQRGERVVLDPAEFTTRIDNPYSPMRPGSRSVYRETDSEGTRRRVVVTVTDKTKMIANGIRARVVHDVVIEGGKRIEETFNWYAQDSAGTVWDLGEDNREYENGKITTTKGSFEAGVDGAQPSILMPARPEVGTTYRREYQDLGEVVSLDAQAEVPFGHFKHVLMAKEVSPAEPKVLDFKFYARNVGPVLAISVSGGSDREELVRHSPAR